MSDIYYNFSHTSSLSGMAPAPMAGGGYAPAALPYGLAGAGMYIITNVNTNNRYIGTSTDLAQRFNTRLATVTEFGFSDATMDDIYVWWGQVYYRHTGDGGHPTVVNDFSAPVEIMLDGVEINIERLLIRYAIIQMGAGGTVSNNVYATSPYVNNTGSPVNVHFHSAANAVYPNFNQDVVWQAGGAGW